MSDQVKKGEMNRVWKKLESLQRKYERNSKLLQQLVRNSENKEEAEASKFQQSYYKEKDQ